jgi:hypothetical protein
MKLPSTRVLAVGTMLWVLSFPLTVVGPLWLWSAVTLTAWITVPAGVYAEIEREEHSKLVLVGSMLPYVAAGIGLACLTEASGDSSTRTHE